MSPEERDCWELTARIAFGGFWNELPDDPTARIRRLARAAVLKDAKRRPKQRRPQTLTTTSTIGGQS
jgi:hypothetical protein